MAKDIKGYSLHTDTEDVSIRTWNRCMTAINIRNDVGAAFAEKYLAQLDNISLAQVQAMFTYIHIVGEDEAKCKIFRGAL